MVNKAVVNVCFVMDDGYSMPTGVAVQSMLDSKRHDTCYKIYILSNRVSNKNKHKLLELSRDDFAITFIDLMDMDKYSSLDIKTISATPTSISKFFIPEILNVLQKVIYLDGDVIVRKDLKKLFDIDLGNNYIGCVKDLCGIEYFNIYKKDFRYCNSGVMLMDLKKMREDNIPDKLLRYRLNGYNDMMDQDALNYVLKDRALILPFKYNTQMNLLADIEQQKSKIFTIQSTRVYYNLPSNYDVDDILSDAVVLHYATSKPWKFYDAYGGTIWTRVFNGSPYRMERLSQASLLANSTSYRIGKMLLSPLVKLKRLKNMYTYRRRRKFFGQFIMDDNGWKCGEADLPKARNYRGDKGGNV